jgi:hypothetical protein
MARSSTLIAVPSFALGWFADAVGNWVGVRGDEDYAVVAATHFHIGRAVRDVVAQTHEGSFGAARARWPVWQPGGC